MDTYVLCFFTIRSPNAGWQRHSVYQLWVLMVHNFLGHPVQLVTKYMKEKMSPLRLNSLEFRHSWLIGCIWTRVNLWEWIFSNVRPRCKPRSSIKSCQKCCSYSWQQSVTQTWQFRNESILIEIVKFKSFKLRYGQSRIAILWNCSLPTAFDKPPEILKNQGTRII